MILLDLKMIMEDINSIEFKFLKNHINLNISYYLILLKNNFHIVLNILIKQITDFHINSKKFFNELF